jgi:hypothetical protein
VSEPVSVRTRFERFPATVKGALVFRGEDRDPHQIHVRGARAVAFGGGMERDVPVEHATVTVPPKQDVFVPFEMAVADLDPGWYGFEVDVDLDGSPRTLHGDRRFSVAWPRGTMRTGTIKLDRSFRVGELRVLVTKLQLASDGATLRLELDPSTDVEVALTAEPGSVPVPVVELDLDARAPGTIVRAYPIPRATRLLRLEVANDAERGSVELPLE